MILKLKNEALLLKLLINHLHILINTPKFC